MDLKELCTALKMEIEMMEESPQSNKPLSKPTSLMHVGVKNS